jgi:hypothetical protein
LYLLVRIRALIDKNGHGQSLTDPARSRGAGL